MSLQSVHGGRLLRAPSGSLKSVLILPGAVGWSVWGAGPWAQARGHTMLAPKVQVSSSR